MKNPNDIIHSPSFQDILDEQYYSLGVTGAEALVAMLEDFNEGRMADFLTEQEVTPEEFLMTVNRLAVLWACENRLNERLGM